VLRGPGLKGLGFKCIGPKLPGIEADDVAHMVGPQCKFMKKSTHRLLFFIQPSTTEQKPSIEMAMCKKRANETDRAKLQTGRRQKQ